MLLGKLLIFLSYSNAIYHLLKGNVLKQKPAYLSPIVVPHLQWSIYQVEVL